MTRVVNVGGLQLGGGNPVLVQSMTNTDTRDAEATLKQICALHDAGCDIVRVSVYDEACAEADFVFHLFAVQVGVGTSCFGIELETDPDVRHLLFQLRCLHAAIGIEEMVLKCIEGDRTVHSARIYVDVAHFAGQILSHRALSA